MTGKGQGPRQHRRGPRQAAPTSGHDGQARASTPAAKPSGLAAREVAVAVVAAVLDSGRSLEDALAAAYAALPVQGIEPRDRAFVRTLVATTLRHARPLQHLIGGYLERPLPDSARTVEHILLVGAAQLILLATPPHAAVSLAVEATRRAPGGGRLDKLVNAVLRRLDREGRAAYAALAPATRAPPSWMFARWVACYGEATAGAIAAASLTEAGLDITPKTDAALWAERLGGELMTTGTIRVMPGGRIEDLPGYAEGAWWVQDAAALLPARLLGDVAGRRVLDLCAAPGGKTAALAATGARVTSLDASEVRSRRMRENLGRLGLSADVVVADARAFDPGHLFDAVLVDAPCSATGTIRRHPDILHLKRAGDLTHLVPLQRELLTHAARLVAPGGRLVYCTCSLEPEEGQAQIAGLLAARDDFTPLPIEPGEAGISAEWISTAGHLRTLPFHTPALADDGGDDKAAALPGMDGFFAARLERRA
ncbi:MAG: transcription antitermination factor NusB [Hyphomicrobiaceae bacterium]|nr:transcription antitermination factor NusB [Hyphomicrobiaceae bacterium]